MYYTRRRREVFRVLGRRGSVSLAGQVLHAVPRSGSWRLRNSPFRRCLHMIPACKGPAICLRAQAHPPTACLIDASAFDISRHIINYVHLASLRAFVAEQPRAPPGVPKNPLQGRLNLSLGSFDRPPPSGIKCLMVHALIVPRHIACSRSRAEWGGPSRGHASFSWSRRKPGRERMIRDGADQGT